MEPHPLFPERRSPALVLGRVSMPGAVYFLTLVEIKRRPSLRVPAISEALRAEIESMAADRAILPIAGIVMPDHVHLLVELGRNLALSKCVARLKARTTVVLRSRGCDWQSNFYDHRLRPEDGLESFALYMYLNPYRAKLIDRDQTWLEWWRWGSLRFEFEEMLARAGCVPKEWLDLPPPGSL